MAGHYQGPGSRMGENPKWKRVCFRCLQYNPRNRQLLERVCLDVAKHGRFHKVKVWWWEEKNHLEVHDDSRPGSIPKIRPMPYLYLDCKFSLCDQSKCRGDRCKYAHSIEEREIWNAKKFGPKDTPSDVHVPTVGKQSRRDVKGTPVHNKTVLQEELTLLNYQPRFSALLSHEQDAHLQKLMRKCDGKYRLVIDKRVNSMMYDNEGTHSNVCGYMVGLDGDQIAYCTQASETITLQDQRGTTYRAKILQANYRQIENKLYVNITDQRATLEKEIDVTATFRLKISYFDRLRSAVASLPNHIIKRIQPGKEEFQLYPMSPAVSQNHSALHLDLCSDDQLEALTAAISSPARGPPFLISGPFGSGKTRILALISRFLFYLHDSKGCTRILVCTQQHISADTFRECFSDLAEKIDKSLEVVRLVPNHYNRKYRGDYTLLCNLSQNHNLQKSNKVLVVTTCSTAYSMFEHHHLPSGYFTHILIDEAAQMREPEAVGPLCFASVDTKIILAGDQHQVGPALLVLGELAQQHGLATSLMERLHTLYTEKLKDEALQYHKALTTSHRCAREIVKLSENLFYKAPLKPSLSSHPDAPFPLHFVCSDIENKLHPLETGISYPGEAAVIVEQVQKWMAKWPLNIWGKKDFKEVVIASQTYSQLHTIKALLKDHFDKKYLDIQRIPTFDIQGKDYRIVILSTSEPTNTDGSARDLTKSICDPFVFNTTISRARSLMVCVGNPYVLLRKEQHMVKRYGDKAKCWSNFLKLCFDKKTFSVSSLAQCTDEEFGWMCSPLPSIVDHFVGAPNPEEQADSKG